MRTAIIAELATGHGGDVALAQEMIRAAAEAGADYAKIQTYDLAKLNPADPQAEWLKQAHLDRAAHEALIETCQQAGIQFLSTPFDAGSLQMLRELGLTTFKIASSESANQWWGEKYDSRESWIVSWPWGRRGVVSQWVTVTHHLTAIPLYPTPLECVGQAELLDGWSDHCEGIEACQMALACGAELLEVHLTIPGARCKPWDKTPDQIRQLRAFADVCSTMRTGVSQAFRERWTA